MIYRAINNELDSLGLGKFQPPSDYHSSKLWLMVNRTLNDLISSSNRMASTAINDKFDEW